MMRILVTGGNGTVGKEVVRRLVGHGFQVKVIGRTRDAEIPGVTYEVCDITKYQALRDAVRGFDAVVHLAALPSPASGTSDQVFLINVQGTFNVFKACEEEGIRRVVQASSINALGVFYGLKESPIRYLPVDEDHPCLSSDSYSFSKHVIEEIGDYYWRRSGISSVALRLPFVAPVSYHETYRDRQNRVGELCNSLLMLPSGERLAWFESAWEKYNRLRAQGFLENRKFSYRMRASQPGLMDDGFFAMSNRVNFWCWLDERDSAQSIEKSLLADFEGSHALFVNDDHNWTGLPSRLLAELFYLDVKTFKKELQGSETLVDISRARRLIGFEVEYSFGS
jgi:nucleoside-diphosphate-sugar epimerase